MSSKFKEACTRQKNREKRKIELKTLNQQNNEEQQTCKSCQIRRARQPKFKNLSTPEMKKSLDKDDHIFWSLLYDPSCKQGTKQLKQKLSNIQRTNKKEKKPIKRYANCN